MLLKSSVAADFLLMKRFVQLTGQAFKRFQTLGNTAEFDSLLLPAAGTLVWTTSNRIVAEYSAPIGVSFAILAWPVTNLPFYVRANGTRYAFNSDYPGAPVAYSTPYAGQLLTSGAVFEFWGYTEAGTMDLPDTTLTISLRADGCGCCNDEPTTITGTPYSPYCAPYPLYYPLP